MNGGLLLGCIAIRVAMAMVGNGVGSRLVLSMSTVQCANWVSLLVTHHKSELRAERHGGNNDSRRVVSRAALSG